MYLAVHCNASLLFLLHRALLLEPLESSTSRKPGNDTARLLTKWAVKVARIHSYRPPPGFLPHQLPSFSSSWFRCTTPYPLPAFIMTATSTSTALQQKAQLAAITNEPIFSRFEALLLSRMDQAASDTAYMQARYLAMRADFPTLPAFARSIVYGEWSNGQRRKGYGDRGVANARKALDLAREARKLQAQQQDDPESQHRTVESNWYDALIRYKSYDLDFKQDAKTVEEPTIS